jgi:hypothetical protein
VHRDDILSKTSNLYFMMFSLSNGQRILVKNVLICDFSKQNLHVHLRFDYISIVESGWMRLCKLTEE